jgi:uncharacterized Zn finger protein
MSRRYWDFYDRFAPSVPLKAKGGIKAQSKRGAFGEKWWAKRWIAVLESFHIGSRLGRGRSYARSGQVLSVDVGKGKVEASVQGSRPTPYKVTIQIQPLSRADWDRVAGALSKQALFTAKLLAGEMPAEVEQVFEKAGLSLFPKKLQDLKTECSCPDWSNPCKHIAAVYYLLGEEFDRDPFLILKLRGLDRDELLNRLGGHRAEPGTEEQPLIAEPLPQDPKNFWGGAAVPEDLLGDATQPAVPAALLRRLGNFPFWRGQVRLLEALQPTYENASPAGLTVFLGERMADIQETIAASSQNRGSQRDRKPR